MPGVLKSINLALAFFLELAMLAAFAVWGFLVGGSTALKFLLGIGIPVIVILLWGAFMAPNSKRRLQGSMYLVVKTVLFGLATAALISAGQVVAGTALAVLYIVNTVLLYI